MPLYKIIKVHKHDLNTSGISMAKIIFSARDSSENILKYFDLYVKKNDYETMFSLVKQLESKEIEINFIKTYNGNKIVNIFDGNIEIYCLEKAEK